LRKNYEIKVIPMINPDGVCAGNYRTNLSGFDLNRRWDGSKTKNLHEAAYIKKYLSQIAKGRDISFILDLHGHSRKMFSFFYGNPSPANPVDVRIFSLLCSKMSPNFIKFEDCTFASE
jgi:cytosolic carboxypeptidase protein 2/3